MKRADFIAHLERRRLRSAAQEYAEEGDRVAQRPGPDERPEFLAHFEPDMIA